MISKDIHFGVNGMYTTFKTMVINAVTQRESIEKKIQEFHTSLSFPSSTSLLLGASQGKNYKETHAPSDPGAVIEWMILPYHPDASYANSVN